MAGFRPGFGRGGITHSFLGPRHCAGILPFGAIVAMPADAVVGFMVRVGGHGASTAGEPAEDGVEAGDAIDIREKATDERPIASMNYNTGLI